MSLKEALVDAVQLLRTLQRTGVTADDVAPKLAGFRSAHPEVDADLVIDSQPGHPDVDFDLLLQVDSTGTIAVGWRPDRAVPWSVRYSEHWASNLVLSVNGRDLTIQEALQALRLKGDAEPNLSTALVNHCLVTAAIRNDPPVVSDSELQDAADRFRAARGLYEAETTNRWLAESGLSLERFEVLLKARVQARKLVDRITPEQVGKYFTSHIDDLAKITVVRMYSRSAETLQQLVVSAAALNDFVGRTLASQSVDGDPEIRMVIETGYGGDVLPMSRADATSASVGTLVGPRLHCGEYCVARVLRHTPARLDPHTYRVVQERLFASWLEAERANAEIRWHWM
jgi:putative peptide maturation system protein